MGTCIICGVEVDGHVCASHEEDVYFEFTGTDPHQLTPGRFYRGSVDGFADFGVFIDIGDHVTGLLHTSELDRRLESLDWQPGDTVFVQVKNVRDNGNVDLGWSIRQHESEFRGTLIETPSGDELPEEAGPAERSGAESGGGTGPDAGIGAEPESGPATGSASEPGSGGAEGGGTVDTAEGGGAGAEETRGGGGPDETRSGGAADSRGGGGPRAVEGRADEGRADDVETDEGSTMDGSAAGDSGVDEAAAEGGPGAEGAAAAESRLSRTAVGDLGDQVGSLVRIEGRVVEARQTSGPTVFEVRDETGAVECAAFEAAGVRAYPEVEAGDVVRIDGEVEERRGDLQVETEALSVLSGEEREAVDGRLEEALAERARPESSDLLAGHPGVEAVGERVVEAATAIRRAVFDARPIVVRHSATVDGYVAGAAIERAALPLIEEEHDEADAVYHFFDRRPLDGRIYGMQDAMRDTTTMLSAQARHGEKVPLFVFANAGSTEESRDGFELVSLYGAESVIVDGDHPDASMADATGVMVSPYLESDDAGRDTSTTALCANVAASVNDGVRDDLRHLPAVSYWRDAPEAYVELAEAAGYDAERTRTLRQAVALEAFYQAYEDKRELVSDLLFCERELAEHASEQFEERVETEVRTARPHVEEWKIDGRTLSVLDVDAFTHEYEFPPIEVLLSELATREEVDAIVGADEDRILLWSEAGIDMREVGERVAEEVPDGGVETRGGRDGHLVFLSGERESVLKATVSSIASSL